MRRIGIDVGGTNTDAVLLQDGRVVHAIKTPTTEDVTGGIVAALRKLSQHSEVARGRIDGVVIGTTHFVNAIVQRRNLSRAAAIRIGLPASASLPPFCDWPEDLAQLVRGEIIMLEGGHEYDGGECMPFDEAGMRAAARQIRDSGLRSVAIAASFSPLDPSHEERARAILAEECPEASITLSHELGRIGLLERENAALLNAALADLARVTIAGFRDAMGVGGGSSVSESSVTFGPQAVGYRLTEEALVFGGKTLTVTDAAVAAAVVKIGEVKNAAGVPRDLARAVLDIAKAKLEDAIDRMKTEAGDVPLIAVGGGAFLVPKKLAGVSEVIRVEHGDCANAVGAAIAQISGETDQVYREMRREDAIAAAEAQAVERAVAAGAERSTLQTVDVEDMPLAYLPGNALRVRVRVAGEMRGPGEH